MPALMGMRAPPLPGSRSGRMIREPARRSRNARSSKDTNTLRAAGEVRAPQFGSAEGDLDTEMVAIAGAIIMQRTGNFDPSTYRDRYQEALQQLIEAKMKRVTIEARAVPTP